MIVDRTSARGGKQTLSLYPLLPPMAEMSDPMLSFGYCTLRPQPKR